MDHRYYDREDGLAHCQVCNGGEGSLPTHCPGRRMTEQEEDDVYAGHLNFKDGNWVHKDPMKPRDGTGVDTILSL